MNILIATDTYYPHVNGAAYFTYRLASHLARRGHKVSVLAPSRHFRDMQSEHDGVTVYGIRSLRIPFYPNFRFTPTWVTERTIRRCVRALRPDIIHIQNHFLIGRSVLREAQRLDIPIVGTNHFMPENIVHYLHLPAKAEEKVSDFGWSQFLQVFNQLDAIAAPTKTAATMAQKVGLTKEVVPISCGIDLERFHPGEATKQLRSAWNIPRDRRVMLYVGRLDKEKKLEDVLTAFAKATKSVEAQFVITGVGARRGKLEEEAARLGVTDRVTFAGFISDEDLPNAYRAADLFVIAGIAELQSIATMEAMASGLPVIAVNATALPELVHDNENGFLFEDGDVDNLAKKIVTVFQDKELAKRFSEASLRIIQNHDIEKTIDAYETFYKEGIAAHVPQEKTVRPKLSTAKAEE